MQIQDSQAAQDLLHRISFYRLRAYIHPFRSTLGGSVGKYVPGTSFDRVVYLYEFDRSLRSAVFDALERIEVAIRAMLIEHLTNRFGTFGHVESRAFDRQFRFKDWLDDHYKEIHRSKEKFIEHFQAKYEGFPLVPCWMALENASFGSLSKLLNGSNLSIRTSIARPFQLNEQVITNWVHVLSSVRNVCAHHSRLWNREFGVVPVRPEKKHDWRWTDPSIGNPRRMFIILMIIRTMLRPLGRDADWIARMEAEFERYFSDPWIARGMGFPFVKNPDGSQSLLDWKSHTLWTGQPPGPPPTPSP